MFSVYGDTFSIMRRVKAVVFLRNPAVGILTPLATVTTEVQNASLDLADDDTLIVEELSQTAADANSFKEFHSANEGATWTEQT